MKYKYYNGTSWVELAEKSELGSLAFLNTLDKLTTTSGYLQYSGDANTYDLHKNQKRSGGLSDLNYYYQLPSEGTLAAPVVLASRSWVMNREIEKTIDDTTNNLKQYQGILAKRKVYTGVIGGANTTQKANTWANRSMYFITVKPKSWNATWRIKYHFNIHLDNENQQYKSSASAGIVYPGKLCRSTHYCSISGGQGIYRAYSSFNTIQDTSYRTCYYTMIHETTEAGFNAGRGHKIGISLTDSYQPVPVTDYSSGSAVANTKYSRTIEVVIDEAVNCEAILEDYIEVEADSVLVGTTYSDDPYVSLESTYYPTNTSASNSAGRWNYITNLYAQGLVETGDDNTIDVLQLSAAYLKNGSKYDNSGTLTGMKCLSYALLGFDKDGNALVLSTYSASQTTRTTSISPKGTRIYEAVGFDYTKGLIYQNSSGYADYDANMDISPRKFSMAIDLRYSDNCVANANATTLGMVSRKPVYLRGIVDIDGLFYLRPLDVTYNNQTYQRAWTQDIPTEEDGYIYWFIGYPYYNSGYANSQYQLDLFSSTQLMWYKDGEFREYIPLAVKSLDSDKLGGTAASSYVLTTDSRLSDARTPTSHSHGAISNDGAISSSYAVTSDLQGVVITNSYNYIRKVTDMPTFRSMIGAGTSNFTGYTSSNKLNSDFIQNNAGWTSVTESTVSGWGFTKNAGTVTQVKVGTTAYNPESGVISLPAYPTVNNSTITVKQTGISDQTFTLNGSATTITLVDTWRPVGTGATDAAAGNHAHGNISNTGTISSTPVTSASGVLVYDSNNKIQRATAAQTRSIIGAGTGTVKKVNNTSPDSNGNVSLTIPATNVIPTTSTAAKLLLSTSTSGTAAWSTWSNVGYLKTGTNGTVSVDTSVVTGSSLTSNNIILGNSNSTVKASSIKLATSSTAWDASSDTLVPTMKRIATSIGQPQQLVNGNNYFEFDGANDSTHDLKVYLAKTLNPSAPAATYYFSLPYATGSSSASPIKLASKRDSISTARDVQIYLHHIRIADHNTDQAGFTFNFILPLATDQLINSLQDLYDTILDEGYDQDWKIYGSGVFYNLVYSGTSYSQELYIADAIAIDSNFYNYLMIYGVQCRQVWNYHCGFICNSYAWGCDDFEIQDEVY